MATPQDKLSFAYEAGTIVSAWQKQHVKELIKFKQELANKENAAATQTEDFLARHTRVLVGGRPPASQPVLISPTPRAAIGGVESDLVLAPGTVSPVH